MVGYGGCPQMEAHKTNMYNTYRTPQQGAHEHTPAQQLKESVNSTTTDGRNYPPYVCDDLIKNYLRPEQEAFIRPILRVLKKPYQVELCTCIMDYMETGIPDIPENMTLGALFMQLTRVGLPECDDPNDKRIIRPLNITSNH